MLSTSAPSEAGYIVGHYDGESAVRRAPAMVVDGLHFSLIDGERVSGPFPFADLTGRGRIGAHVQYGLKGRPGWRIDLPPPIPDAILMRLPPAENYGRVIDRIGLWKGAAVCAGIAALVVFGVAQLPELAARLIPQSVERRLGSALVGDFGNRTCNSAAGEAALLKLVDRLGPEAHQAEIRVVNVPIVNAVALPGGHVLLFDGLVRKAASPDEVAGVLAHELGHVANRDVLAALIRQLGLSVVLGGLNGDVGGWLNTLLAAGYSRGAESNADGYAIDMLRQAHVSPLATAGFFQRLAVVERGAPRASAVLGYMSSHPMSDTRRKRFADSARKDGSDRPALTPEEWKALRNICRDDPDVSKTEFSF